ncbi:MAG: hypothetical protein V3V19_02530 [Cocleimonas sp.]
MDEKIYKDIYNELNPNRCIFEKAITNQRCGCELKRRFVIANRECIACESESALKACTNTLDAMRDNARFSLKVVTVNGPMPHNKELQVQAGGMLALQSLVLNDSSTTEKIVTNVNHTVELAIEKYGDLDSLPYGEIVKSIVKYQSRPKRSKKKK